MSDVLLVGNKMGIKISKKVFSLRDVELIISPSPSLDNEKSDSVRGSEIDGEYDYYEYKSVNSEKTKQRVKKYNPEVVYIFGSSQILDAEFLNLARKGCLGGHISLLPSNRGCNPIIWAIANGLSQHGVTMIWLDEGVDTGDIAAQRPFQIGPDEHAGDVYEKVESLYIEMLEDELLPQFQQGEFPRRPQPEGPSNYWRRRSPVDGRIDWRMSARRIHNLVRALYHPYPGADAVYDGEKHKIWKTEPEPASETRIPGEVLDILDESILVKAGNDAIWLYEHGLPVGNIDKGEFFPQV